MQALRQENYRRLLVIFVAVSIATAFSVAFFRTAWVSDDAFITFRVVENVLNGLGPVWNPSERVQVYTHPLWFGLLIPLRWITSDLYWSSIWLSFSLLIITLAMVSKLRDDWYWAPTVAVCSLLFSRAFIDYSSSGLENPLIHTLIVLFLLVWSRPSGNTRTLLLWTITSALFLTRPDILVIIFPALLLEASRYRTSSDFIAAIAGIIPTLAWILYSLFYYGSPVPNTALAKVGTGADALQNFGQAMAYLRWSTTNDLASILIIAIGTYFGLLRAKTRPFAVGLIAWICYLFYIGSDYMGGRFLSTPVLLACALLVLSATRISGLVLVIALAACAPNLRTTIFSSGDYHNQSISLNGIADERGVYYQYTGVLPALQKGTWKLHPWLHAGYALKNHPGVYTRCAIGMAGFAAGQELHWLDPLALADPLLSRLPARTGSRVGHYERAFPNGYLSTLVTGTNQIESPGISALYDDILLATRAPLSSSARLGAIYRLNSNHHEDALSDYDPEAIGLPGVQVQTRSPLSCFGIPYGADGTWLIQDDPERVARVVFTTQTVPF